MAISPRLPRRKLYTFFEINFFFIGKGHFAFFERYVRGNIHCSFYAHWKARSGLPISDNWTFFRQMLMDCPELRDVRLKYFTASSLKDIFESVDNQIIIDFIKDAHFYHQFWISIRSRRFWRDRSVWLKISGRRERHHSLLLLLLLSLFVPKVQ